MHILIAGSSGLIGTALCRRLSAGGHEPVRLVRPGSRRPPSGGEHVTWDPRAGELPAEAIDRADVVVNLAGAGIGDHRWTDSYRRELVESRLQSTDLLARAIAASPTPPQVFLSGSAVGWYGDRGDEQLDETSGPGSGFLADLCTRWEDAAAPAGGAGTRVVLLRTGVVLSADGGALAKQLPLFKFGLGGRFGSGRQWQSWITLDDHVAAVEHLLTADVHGPVNLTAPEPATNATFTSTLGRVLHRPAILRIPSFGPKLLLGSELVETVLLGGQRVLPRRLEESGFRFSEPRLEGALRAVLGR
ncbi:MAG: TIGR01777 family oxidoreductase [Ilumatobacteraceae bacterium]